MKRNEFIDKEFIDKLEKACTGDDNAFIEVFKVYDILRLKELNQRQELISLNERLKELKKSNGYLKQENQRLNNVLNELEKIANDNIEVLENRLSTPFCNFEKTTKELMIHNFYLEKLNELKESDK